MIETAIRRIQELQAEVNRTHRELHDAKAATTRALGALRTQLRPLYEALRLVFGELDKAGVSESAAPIGDPRTAKVWADWKTRIPGRPAQVIDALLLHGEMNSTQIAIAVGIHRNNVPQYIHKLNKAGLITRNGTKYSLKSL